MIPEQEITQQESLLPKGYNAESFHITDKDQLSQWTYDVWPQLQALFDTTWPDLSTSHEDFYRDVLQQKDAAAILLREKGDNKIVGASFVYPVQFYKRSKDEIFYPEDGKTAYNSTVIVNPLLRSKGLMVPLLEESMKEASGFGYDYMVGHYNASVGQMPDGRFVKNGFANRIRQTKWTQGEIVFPTTPLLSHDSKGNAEPVENIVFRLNKPQSVQAVALIRRNQFPSAVA